MAATESRTVTPHQLHQALAAEPGLALIDVRTPVEFREVHVAEARNLPLDRLTPAVADGVRKGDGDLYLVCHTGSRARQAGEQLQRDGIERVVIVEGGTQAWVEAGLPVVRGKQAMSLERQVRIAAGALVLLGCGLSVLVHPYLLGIAAFVGAGLLFAGITGFCGMGLLLARMPWNQVRAGGSQ